MIQSDILYWLPRLDAVALALAVVLWIFWLTAVSPVRWWGIRVGWLGAAVGALLFPPAIAWVQVPLQLATGNALLGWLGAETLRSNLLLTRIPTILESGLVQELAKLLPLLAFVVIVRPRGNRSLLAMGAAVGAGFGACEAAWLFGLVFASGWTTDTISLAGWQALVPFFERFFTVGFHTASAVILAYGLTRGAAPAAYVAAALLHAATNYTAVLVQAGMLDPLTTEAIVAVWALIAVAVAIYLGRRAVSRVSVLYSRD